MSGKVPPFLRAKHSLNQSRHTERKKSIYQSLGLTFPSLSSYIPVVFFGTHSLTLLDYHQALKLLNNVICHTLCADWLAVHVIFGDCNPPETFYHIVSPTYHAFTHQMFATDDFIAPCIHFNSCLSHIMFESELHLFHVYVYWCVVD